MSLNKKLLASAVLAGLAFSANVSAVELGVDDPIAFASEIADDTQLLTAADDVTFEIGYNFSNGEVRYGRYECSTNLTMDNVTLSETGGNVALGAINGEGTSALFFSMTGNGVPSETDVIGVASDNTLEDGGDVSCAFSIYDQPSQAQAGGTAGRIHTTGFATVITRESGFVFTHDATMSRVATADVESAGGAYFDFVGFDSSFGNLTFEAVTGVLSPAGVQITLGDIFDPTSTVEFEGDLSAAADPTCPIWNTVNGFCPADVDGNVETFAAFDVAGSGEFMYWWSGTDPIQESEYYATLNAVANTDYVVADVGPIFVGEIVRNGTQLQAPLAQVPGGWLSRMILTNTGAVARPYEISIMGESGNIIGVDSTLLVGLVPANGTKVVDLNEILLTFSNARRATLNVTVAASNNQIQGMYQIVNPESGSLSNETMVRPGTN